jgi:hypothetical protein
MRKIRVILLVLAATIILCVALLAILVAALNDNHYRWIVTRAADHFAGLEVNVEGPFAVELSSEPFITASNIRISDVSGPTPATAEIGRLEVKVALLPLISGTVLIRHLLIHDATVAIVRRAEDRTGALKPEKEKPFEILIPVVESVSLRNVRMTVSDEDKSEAVHLLLANLSLDDVGDERCLHVKGDGTLNAKAFEIDGQLGSLSNMLKGDEPYPVDLKLGGAGLGLTVSGTIDNPIHGKGLNIQVSGEQAELADTLRLFWKDIPNVGHLNLKGTVTGDATAPSVSKLNMTISDASRFQFAAKGSITNLMNMEGATISFSGSCTNRDIIKMFLPDDQPDFAEVKMEGNMIEAQGDYALKITDVYVADDRGLAIRGDGSTSLAGPMNALRMKETDVRFQISSPTTEAAKPVLFDWLPEMGALSISGRVLGAQDQYQFDKLHGRASDAQGLVVEVSGQVAISTGEAREAPGEMDLNVSIAAPNMGATEPLLGDKYLSDLGPVLANGKIIGTTEVLSIENISITLGESGPVRMEWRGRVGKIPLGDDQLVSDVEIFGSIHAQKASALASLAGVSVPDVGPLKATYRFVEQEGIYGFNDIQLSIGSQEGLWLKGAGSLDVTMKDGAVSLGGLNADIAAYAPNLSAIAMVADLDLPDLRPLALKARIIDRDGRLNILDIEEFKLDAGTEKGAFLRIQGQAGGLRGGDQRVVEASFETTSKPWVMKILEGSVPENHVVEGKLKIAGTPRHMRIKELEVETTGPNRMYLEADGTVKEIEGAYEFEGHIASGASDITVLRSFLGIELPPLGAPQLDGQITGNMKKASFKGTVRLGRSELKTTLSHTLTTQRPRVTAKIVAPTVYLADVSVYPEQPEDLPPQTKSEPQPDSRLFDDRPLPFDALKGIDLSVSVDADNIMGKDFALKKLDLDMSLEDGKLQIAPVKVAYKNGFASIDFTIDTVGSKPEMALKVTAEDVDIGALLAHIHEPPSLKGQLNLVLDLKSAGRSAREIATALKGDFGLAVEKGQIMRTVEFMGADAVRVLTAMRSRGEYKDLHCMALRFVFDKGRGKSEIIYLETPDMFARGGGLIDLHAETMELVLQPKPKKGLRGTTSPVHIKGPIADPKVRKLPFREAAKLYGEIMMPVVFLPARALGYLWYLIRKDMEGESPCLHVIPQDE